MILLRNHTHPEPMKELIDQKNEKVKYACVVNKDTESFNSHSHNSDQEGGNNAPTKNEPKPLRGSNFPERQSRGRNPQQSHRPHPSINPIKKNP